MDLPDDVDAAVEARMDRQRVLYTGDRRFLVVVEEQVLRTRVGDKPRDLQLLRRQLLHRGNIPPARRLARRPQLRLGPLRPRHRAQRPERFQCSTQMTTRIGAPPRPRVNKPLQAGQIRLGRGDDGE